MKKTGMLKDLEGEEVMAPVLQMASEFALKKKTFCRDACGCNQGDEEQMAISKMKENKKNQKQHQKKSIASYSLDKMHLNIRGTHRLKINHG